MRSASTAGTVDETVGYDRMGNITRLARSAPQAAKFGYTYINSGKSNLLTAVNDTLGNSRAYTYDGNGNALGDGMGKTISYNMLNLPAQVSTGTTVLATYTYDADGSKLANVSSANGSWYYDNGIVYSNTHGTGANVIDFIQTEEGKATLAPGATQYAYSYNFKDYLGNIRASFDNTGTGGASKTLQEDDYYAFGLDEPIYTPVAPKRYLYNGKEKQLDLVNQYDYGARFYDPVIARWTSVDPLAEKGRRWSPYNYVQNNPIMRVDPDGMKDSVAKSKPVSADVNKALSKGKMVGDIAPEQPPTPYINADGTQDHDAYNCHSFAWDNSQGDPKDPANAYDVNRGYPKWDEDPLSKTNNYVQLPFDMPNQEGDKVIYFNTDENDNVIPTHSADVTGVDKNGNTTQVTSKWGQLGVYKHHPRDVPDSYSADAPTAKTRSGNTYETRVYYRSKQTVFGQAASAATQALGEIL